MLQQEQIDEAKLPATGSLRRQHLRTEQMQAEQQAANGRTANPQGSGGFRAASGVTGDDD